SARLEARLGERILVEVEDRRAARERQDDLLVGTDGLFVEDVDVVAGLHALGLHQVVQRLQGFVQVELEPPYVRQQGDVGRILCREGRGQLARQVLVRVLILQGDLDVLLRLIEAIDELLLNVGVVSAERTPVGDRDGRASARYRWRRCLLWRLRRRRPSGRRLSSGLRRLCRGRALTGCQ